MRKRTFIAFLISAILVIAPLMNSSFSAEEATKEMLSKIYNEEKDICKAVKKAIQKDINTKEVVKTYIQMGHDACLVVRCAIQAKGDLEQIITGALEAGTTPDVCSRCALEAGADVQELERILQIGKEPIETKLPGEGMGGGIISPVTP